MVESLDEPEFVGRRDARPGLRRTGSRAAQTRALLSWTERNRTSTERGPAGAARIAGWRHDGSRGRPRRAVRRRTVVERAHRRSCSRDCEVGQARVAVRGCRLAPHLREGDRSPRRLVPPRCARRHGNARGRPAASCVDTASGRVAAGARASTKAHPAGLTRREQEVLELRLRGSDQRRDLRAALPVDEDGRSPRLVDPGEARGPLTQAGRSGGSPARSRGCRHLIRPDQDGQPRLPSG